MSKAHGKILAGAWNAAYLFGFGGLFGVGGLFGFGGLKRLATRITPANNAPRARTAMIAFFTPGATNTGPATCVKEIGGTAVGAVVGTH